MPDDPSPTGVLVDSSVRDLAEDLGIDYRSLFVDLGKATVSGLVGFSTGNPAAFGNAIGNVINAFSAFEDRPDIYEKVGDDPGKLAWLLLHQSLLSAVTDLVLDHDARFRAAYQDADELPTEEEIAEDLEASLDLTLTDAEVQITASFFDRPTDLGLLESLQQDLRAWFEAVGVPEGEARSITNRLPSYFRTALIEEWRAHPEYQRLEEAVRVPFAHAERRAPAWEAYRAYLQKQVEEPVFGEAVGLRQIYVWPRTFVRVPAEDDEAEQPPPSRTNGPEEGELRGESEYERHVSWLRESVLRWLESDDESDAIRIIKGDPGTGKSSFSKMLAAELAEENEHTVLFAPLNRLDATKQLRETIQDFVSAPDHPLNGIDPFEETPLLLILDGLDELSKRGRVGADVARDFVDEIDRALRGLNQGSVAVRVLLSGRRIAADAGAKILRDPTKVYNLIPFVPEGDADRYEDPDRIAFDEDEEPIDHRDDWWQKYGEASGSDYDGGMPSRLRRDRLGDITRQPLLNYLVALAYEEDETDFSEDASLNTLYNHLLGGVYRRDYDFGPHPGTKVVSGATEDLQKEGFVRVLEEIALDAWHGDRRTTTLASIEERCRDTGLLDHFENVQDKLATGISQLLAAFYFRKTGQTPQGEATFEFTHKTFAEYLTALRIVRTVKQIHEARQQHEQQGGLAGRDLVGGLKAWIEVCGPSAMDEDLFQFFADEIRIRHEDANCAGDWQETFADFIRHVLRHDVPMHRLDEALDYSTERVWARNAEEALLAVVDACRRALLAGVDESEREAGRYAIDVLEDVQLGTAGEWIRRLQAPRSEHSSGLYANLLSSVVWAFGNISFSFIQGANFRAGDLREVNLQRASLHGADLREADLREAVLHGADLERADLREAVLQEADLERADLRRTDLHRADLRGASLCQAITPASIFKEANLQGADLDLANLSFSSFRRSSLQEAVLLGTTLLETDLRGADLRGATLQQADLRDANLQGANLRGADFREVQWTETTQFDGVEIDGSTQMNNDLRDHILSKNPKLADEMSEASEK